MKAYLINVNDGRTDKNTVEGEVKHVVKDFCDEMLS